MKYYDMIQIMEILIQKIDNGNIKIEIDNGNINIENR